MELSVRQAADQIGVSSSRVRDWLKDGVLPGRRLGRIWLVDAGAVALLAGQVRLPGRPMSPARGWALLDLLDGGEAAWLQPVARSQVRALLRELVAGGPAPPERWRGLLRLRSQLLRVHVHPAALKRLVRDQSPALLAGVQQAMLHGMDLVAVSGATEAYVPGSAWPDVATSWGAREDVTHPNLLVRLPRGVWPFERQGQVSSPALAADLLESREPRAVVAGSDFLNERASAAVEAAGWEKGVRRGSRGG